MNELTDQFNYIYIYEESMSFSRLYFHLGIYAKGYEYHCMWSYDNE